MIEHATDDDIATMTAQLGRPVRDVVGVSARCGCGAPAVVATRPRLANGTPFPTFHYLTHPDATVAASRLEASGVMGELQDRLDDPEVAAAYLRAHEAYLAERAEHGEVPEIDGISAGGMPTRVKCLHALVAHSLAAGPGVNPIGDAALALGDWQPETCTCSRPAADGEAEGPATTSRGAVEQE